MIGLYVSLAVLTLVVGVIVYFILFLKGKMKDKIIYELDNPPAPHPTEEVGTFISRCIEDPEVVKAYPEMSRRVNVCAALWRANKE